MAVIIRINIQNSKRMPGFEYDVIIAFDFEAFAKYAAFGFLCL